MTDTPNNDAAIARSGIPAADILKIDDTPDGIGIVSAKSHLVTDPGDALPVSVQRGLGDWQARGEPDPEGDSR